MKIWMVTEDTYSGWGTEEHCYGLFSSREMAEECAKKHKYADIAMWDVDVEEDVVIARYYE